MLVQGGAVPCSVRLPDRQLQPGAGPGQVPALLRAGGHRQGGPGHIAGPAQAALWTPGPADRPDQPGHQSTCPHQAVLIPL